ncbi:hypothetical protein Syun_020750 [Stephania yunnanensis]|uniref:RNase H type-1 domain-containing protein n=1 Tax=Stephania yunnanensis TaxID=152371 RepID=A0AAP0IEH9_9MAGN
MQSEVNRGITAAATGEGPPKKGPPLEATKVNRRGEVLREDSHRGLDVPKVVTDVAISREPNKDGLEKACLVFLSILRFRNDMLWKRRSKPLDMIIGEQMEWLREWRSLHANPKGVSNGNACVRDSVRWQKPKLGFVKCNVDVAVWEAEGLLGTGAVVRDDQGHLTQGFTTMNVGRCSSHEAEAIAFREVLSWIKHMPVPKVVFELDSLIVVQNINSSAPNNTEFGSIIQNCKELLGSRSRWKVQFVKREDNSVAHAMAKLAKLHARDSEWCEFPQEIIELNVQDVISH